MKGFLLSGPQELREEVIINLPAGGSNASYSLRDHVFRFKPCNKNAGKIVLSGC